MEEDTTLESEGVSHQELLGSQWDTMSTGHRQRYGQCRFLFISTAFQQMELSSKITRDFPSSSVV